jgi:hypothetical protein
MLAQGHKGRQLVAHLDAKRACRARAALRGGPRAGPRPGSRVAFPEDAEVSTGSALLHAEIGSFARSSRAEQLHPEPYGEVHT